MCEYCSSILTSRNTHSVAPTSALRKKETKTQEKETFVWDISDMYSIRMIVLF